jgi:hypothetical protein
MELGHLTIINMNPFRINYAEELKSRIGFPVSENFSPTLRAKLVSIHPYHGTCTMEVLPSPYELNKEHNHRAGELYLAPAARIWNAYNF